MATIEVLDLPDDEAVRRLRAKGFLAGFDWRDVSAAEHAVAFTAAKAMRLDVLEAIRAEVDRAIAQGTTLAEFQRALRPRLEKLGWWGRRPMEDPRTGEVRPVQLGSPRRLRIIFDTNLRMAHARGKWDRIQRLREELPYLRYVGVDDSRTRPEHRRWHGTILPADHPWWSTHFPPNGWNCRCTVQQLSEDDMERRGGVREPADFGGRNWKNARTGETRRVPKGIDPGFDHNPGAVRPGPEAQALLQRKIDAAKPDVAAAARAAERSDATAKIVQGRQERIDIENAILNESGRAPGEPLGPKPGAKAAEDWAAAFRAELHRRLRGRRGAGTATAKVTGEAAAAQRVREASRLYPAGWVEAGNAQPVIARLGRRGAYSFDLRRATVRDTLDSAVHEYAHHLQGAMRPMQDIVLAEHVRRTTKGGARDPLEAIRPGSSESGRRDGYVDDYAGRDYRFPAWYGDGVEVLTTHMQMILTRYQGAERLPRLARDDPAMLDLMLGLLFRYDP